MRGGVLEKLGDFFHSIFGSLCFFGGDGAEVGKYSAVDSAGIIEEFSYDALNFVDTCFVERG